MAGRRVRILRVRLDLQGRLTPVTALGVVSVSAVYQPYVRFDVIPVSLFLLCWVRAVGGWMVVCISLSSLAFPYHSSHK
jgi:hypothetical protein